MPQDVEGEAYDYPEHFLQKRVWHLDRRPISASQLERATPLIKAAEKPIMSAAAVFATAVLKRASHLLKI